jgi:hypothetical protein
MNFKAQTDFDIDWFFQTCGLTGTISLKIEAADIQDA